MLAHLASTDLLLELKVQYVYDIALTTQTHTHTTAKGSEFRNFEGKILMGGHTVPYYMYTSCKFCG